MSDEVKQARGGAVPGWIKAVLVVSLSLNLLIAGAVVGSVFSGGRWSPDHGRHMAGGGPMARALSEDDRRFIRQRMTMEFMSDREVRGAYRDEMTALLADLRADPYDPEAVEARMAGMRAHFLHRFETGQALLGERLAEMSRAERAAYAERLEAALSRRP